MADDLDKFVLQYSVDLKDSVTKLEKLHEKMSQVQDTHKKNQSSAKEFAADLTDELGKAVPGLSAVSKIVRGIGAELSFAAAGIALLAGGIKSVLDLRAQYNMQRQAGMDLGVSGIRVENWQRQFAGRSGGMVSRDQALEGLRKFREMTRAAYTDPSRMGKENFILRRLGVGVGSPGSPTGFNDQLSQLATSLQGKSQEQVQGIAQATGFSQDWLMTLQKLGPEVGHITAMTADEVKARQAAQDSLDAYNKSLGDMKKDLNELEIKIGQGLIPAFDTLIKMVSGFVDTINKLTSHPVDPSEIAEQPAFGDGAGGKKVSSFGKLGDWLGSVFGGSDSDKKEQKQKADEEKKKQEQAKKDEEAKAEKMAEAEDAQRKQAQATADQFTLAINQFSASVGDFAGTAPSIQEVLAAWAGSAGAAAGLTSGGTGAGATTAGMKGGSTWQQSQYAAQIGAAAKKYGLDPQEVYAVMQVESEGINGRYSNTGAGGLMQVTRGNWKAYGGGANIMDPAANIMVGARILKESYGMAHGNRDAALRQYNGNSDPNYIAKFNRAYGKGGDGWEKGDIRRNEVAKGIAGFLGVPYDQVLRGGVSQRDIAAAVGASQGKLSNEIVGLNTGIATLQGSNDPNAKMKLGDLQAKLRKDQMSLQNLRAYGSSLIAGGSMNAGDNLPKIDQMVANFNITSTDPKAVAAEVEKVFTAHVNDTVDNFSNGRKS